MPKKITLKTKTGTKRVSDHLKTLPQDQRTEATALLKLFSDATGAKPRMWGDSIIGFGEYTYHRSNGDEGVFLATGFAIRKSGPTIYIMPGYNDYSDILQKLGPHKLGKSCLYLKQLDDIDQRVLSRLIKTGLKDLKKAHPVSL